MNDHNKPGVVRKLAREATIFALLGMLVAVTAVFVFADLRDGANAKNEAAKAVHADIDWFTVNSPKPAPTVSVPLSNGTVLQVRRCGAGNIFDRIAAAINPGDCRAFSEDREDGQAKEVGGELISIPLGDKNQVAIEKDYWTAYKNSRHQRVAGEVLQSLLFGSLGFPAGIALWIFYRLVRFAIQG